MVGDRVWKTAENLRSPSAKECLIVCVIGLAAVSIATTPIAARGDSTVRENLLGCHAAVDDKLTVADRIGATGRCTGITLIFLGQRLPDHVRFCVPRSIRHYEVMRVVAELEQQYPLVENQNVTISAMAILHTRWPCNAPKQ